jgi:nucleotide-binding universal stress UspA family protein
VISTVAVATDGSSTATVAVKAAAEVAKRFDAKLVLLSACSQGAAPLDQGAADEEVQWAFSDAARTRQILGRTEDELRREGIDCSQLIDEGDPAEVIVGLAGECAADLLVVGNRGMKRRLLGSVPNTVTHRAPCSVMVVKTT